MEVEAGLPKSQKGKDGADALLSEHPSTSMQVVSLPHCHATQRPKHGILHATMRAAPQGPPPSDGFLTFCRVMNGITAIAAILCGVAFAMALSASAQVRAGRCMLKIRLRLLCC